MRKSMLLGVVLVIMLLSVTGCGKTEQKETRTYTDKELVQMYMDDKYGERDYRIALFANTDNPEYIKYEVKSEDGEVDLFGKAKRSYLNAYFTE